jgi:hypothetical protein
MVAPIWAYSVPLAALVRLRRRRNRADHKAPSSSQDRGRNTSPANRTGPQLRCLRCADNEPDDKAQSTRRMESYLISPHKRPAFAQPPSRNAPPSTGSVDQHF